ncbi:urea ABC transporter permease subunit UrtB [Derxia gummosa]|uniref:Urea ABC transporter permease subunit UrtB n=1 Tax=Derxia gummosa DSM 723 TaxID=1121388 RepID=A0A8B6X2V9_9BURK|nr:urea ABC transporter permease subunit UrtB [Derxia gummosa]
MLRRLLLLATLLLVTLGSARAAPDAALVLKLADEDSDARVEAIGKLAEAGDPRTVAIFEALANDALYSVTDADGKVVRLLVSADDKYTDAVTGEVVSPVPDNAEGLSINNRLRGELDAGLALLRLGSADRATRVAAARALQGSENLAILPALQKAAETEKDEEIKALLVTAEAALEIKSDDPAVRAAAAKKLAAGDSTEIRQLLAGLLEKSGDSYAEPDATVRAAAQAALDDINGRLKKYEMLANLFSGISLGSILLLAALGLAITYGLMGIINMAHGELLMIGAYSTYVVQGLFRKYAPGAFDWYVVAALPVAFLVTAAVGMVLERTIIRWLYGRPLETLLTTWGISLLLIQACRTIFGAQNVEVENPSWMSGGIALAGGIVIPFNRIIIVLFSFAVLFAVYLLIARTRLGLFVRAVTQNRKMASCCGVPTHRIDMLTFGLGAGVAGLGGVALSQIGNVGPDLGRSYIVDSFMVVVFGGVGQLAGTVIAALGLGSLSKFLEPWSGAVLAKIMVLVFIILFIQKRPQGLFAVKGRSVEA